MMLRMYTFQCHQSKTSLVVNGHYNKYNFCKKKRKKKDCVSKSLQKREKNIERLITLVRKDIKFAITPLATV